MKKLFKTMVISTLLVLSLATTAFANPVNDIRNELISMGIPTNYVANVVEYLQKTTISDAQYKKAMTYIDSAKSIVGGTKDISKLPASDKAKLQELAVSCGNVLGVSVNFGKNPQGVTVVSVIDPNGGTLLQLSTLEVIDVVTDFNPEVLVDILEEIVEFSNNPEKGDFNAVSGELNKTGLPYGNMMVMGTVLIVFAAGIFVVSKRQFA